MSVSDVGYPEDEQVEGEEGDAASEPEPEPADTTFSDFGEEDPPEDLASADSEEEEAPEE